MQFEKYFSGNLMIQVVLGEWITLIKEVLVLTLLKLHSVFITISQINKNSPKIKTIIHKED